MKQKIILLNITDRKYNFANYKIIKLLEYAWIRKDRIL